jgi:hypothetical protein
MFPGSNACCRRAKAHPERTVFTRFVPPERPGDAAGAWRRYYAHWRHMTERLDPRLIQLVPPLTALVPPAPCSTIPHPTAHGVSYAHRAPSVPKQATTDDTTESEI